MARAFLESIPPELTSAAASKDRAAFAAAFQHAATMCNACHMSAARGFIQVPYVPGQSVPVLDPLPSASRGGPMIRWREPPPAPAAPLAFLLNANGATAQRMLQKKHSL
jgi:hypothetical protein